MFEALQSHFFIDKYEYDLREPELFLGSIGVTSTVSFDRQYMLQFMMILLFEFATYIVAALITYFFVVKRRGTSTSYLVGFGIVMPMLLYMPFHVVQVFDVRNAALLINTAAGAAVIVPRLFEAIYGTTPAFAEKNLGMFTLYFAVCLVFRQDPKTNAAAHATPVEIRNRMVKVCVMSMAASVLYSALVPAGYALFPSRRIESFVDLFYWGHMLNNYMIAVLMSLVIDVASTSAGVSVSLLTGISTEDVNSYPLIASTSLSEFWGQRWNRLVSTGLKEGIYKPFRIMGYSRNVGAVATFLASGILHEYTLLVLASRRGVANNPDHVPYEHQYGNQLIFFIYNAVLLLLEYELARLPSMRWVQKHVPRAFRTFFVMLLVCPVGHLFVDEYINSGILSDVAMFFPKFVYVGKATFWNK